jgi:hypothetical protein
MKPFRLVLTALALSSGAAFAGSADVKFVDPDRYTDLATNPSQERETMNAIGAHLQRLAAALPPDQVLHVDVLDVDLAGYSRPTRRGNVRVNNGLADAPMIQLRYTLEARGQAIRSGNERITDLGYTHPAGSWRSTGQYYYEKRMLSDWFERNFRETHAAR